MLGAPNNSAKRHILRPNYPYLYYTSNATVLLAMHPLVPIANLIPLILFLIVVRRWFSECSSLAQWAIAWLLSQVVVTASTYLLSCTLVSFVSPTLYAANTILLGIEVCLLVAVAIYNRQAIKTWRPNLSGYLTTATLRSAIYTALCLTFSYFLFDVQFFEQDGTLHRSLVYWDITAHYPIVQSFIFGDNFPARDETAAELPLLYHFFSDLQIANNGALGASLTNAFLLVSVLSLTSLMILVREYARVLFKSEVAGWVAGVLVITSSNLRWAVDFLNPWSHFGLLEPLYEPVHPFIYSVPKYPFATFNVSMFNVFYFVEERHVIFASALVIVTALFVRAHFRPSLLAAITSGAVLGMFCEWNFFILPLLLLILFSGIIIPGRRAALFAMLCSVCLVTGYLMLSTKAVLASSEWFNKNYVRLRFNFNFATDRPGDVINLWRFIQYYAFCAGPTLMCAGLALCVLWGRSRRDFWVLMPITIGTFILINTVQPMPNSIYENHKWVKPLQGFLNILAVAPIALLLQKKTALRVTSATLMVIALTISGIAEAIAFLRCPSMVFSPYPSELVNLIRDKTQPQDVFITALPSQVLLAGRRVYYLDRSNLGGTQPHIQGLGFRFKKRAAREARIFASKSIEEFCAIAQELRVNVVEFSKSQQTLAIFASLTDKVLFTAPPWNEAEPRAYVSTAFCSAG